MNKGDFSNVNFENAQLTKAGAGHVSDPIIEQIIFII